MALGSSKWYKEAYDRAIALCKERDYHAAILEFEIAIEIDTQNPMAYYGLGQVYLEIGDWDSAIEYNKMAVSRNGALYEAYMNLGLAYGKKAVKTDDDQFRKLAATAHAKAANLKPRSTQALHALGYDQWMLGDFPAAIKSLDAVIEIDPDNRFARGLLARIHLTQGRIETAWRVYWGLPQRTSRRG